MMRKSLSIAAAFVLLFFSSLSFSKQPFLVITGASTWQPFSFINEKGQPDGIMVDFWKLYGEINNVDIDFHLLPWSESLDYVKKNHHVVHGGVGYTESRGTDLFFSHELPFNFYRTGLFARKKHIFDEINSAGASMVGLVKESTPYDFLLSRIPYERIKQFPTFDALHEALSRGEIDFFINDVDSSDYRLHARNEKNDFELKQNLYSFPMHFVVHKESMAQAALIERNVSKISDEAITQIYQKWFPERFLEDSPFFKLETFAVLFVLLFSIGGAVYHRRLVLNSAKLKSALAELNDSTNKLKNISETDALTGAKTRHQFFAELSDKRFSIAPYAIAVIGIDRLKMINERHGQDIGDMVLKHLTYQLKWQLGENLFARLCGGEFAILFYGMDRKQAEDKMIQLQKNLKDNPLYIDQQIIPAEISFGIACYPCDEKQGEALVRIAANRMRLGRSLIEDEIETNEITPALLNSFT